MWLSQTWKPRLVNTVSDVIESGIRVAFYKGTGVYSNLRAAPDGSDARVLLKHALERSGNRTSDITLAFGPHRSLVTIVLDVSYEVALRLDCAQSESGKFYKSQDVIFSERRVILFSRTCDPEIRCRVNHIHVRAMESGIIVKNGKIIQIWSFQFISMVLQLQPPVFMETKVSPIGKDSLVTKQFPIKNLTYSFFIYPESTQPVQLS